MKLMKQYSKTNPLILTTQAKAALSTDHRRKLYFKEHFHVIEPIEYLYDRTHKNAFVYVSIIQVLESTETGRFFR